MSWGCTVTVGEDEGAREALERGLNEYLGKQEWEPTAEVRTQMDALCKAAEALIQSGALGEVGSYRVVMSGHANPGHAPATGWSNDYVGLNVQAETPSEGA